MDGGAMQCLLSLHGNARQSVFQPTGHASLPRLRPLAAHLCSRLEAGLASQQQQLQSRLAAVQMLSERREAVATQLAALQQLCMQAQVRARPMHARLPPASPRLSWCA